MVPTTQVSIATRKKVSFQNDVWYIVFLSELQSTPANPETEGTGQNRPDTAESGLAWIKFTESGLKGQKCLSGCRGNPG